MCVSVLTRAEVLLPWPAQGHSKPSPWVSREKTVKNTEKTPRAVYCKKNNKLSSPPHPVASLDAEGVTTH